MVRREILASGGPVSGSRAASPCHIERSRKAAGWLLIIMSLATSVCFCFGVARVCAGGPALILGGSMDPFLMNPPDRAAPHTTIGVLFIVSFINKLLLTNDIFSPIIGMQEEQVHKLRGMTWDSLLNAANAARRSSCST